MARLVEMGDKPHGGVRCWPLFFHFFLKKKGPQSLLFPTTTTTTQGVVVDREKDPVTEQELAEGAHLPSTCHRRLLRPRGPSHPVGPPPSPPQPPRHTSSSTSSPPGRRPPRRGGMAGAFAAPWDRAKVSARTAAARGGPLRRRLTAD